MNALAKLLFGVFFIATFDLNAQNLYFPPISGTTWDSISPQSIGWCQEKIDSLYNYLDANNTKAFIVLKDGKIVLEKYFGTFDQNSLWYWASAGKTITSFMTGIAQQEGYLSLTDKTSDYLGQGWTDCSIAQEDQITIWNQLTMTSGLDDGVADNHCTLDTCLVYLADAGTRWAYHNAPYTLLGPVIENATGQTLNTYTTQKLKNPTGMNGLFYSSGYTNVFYSTARSMARFGLLILNNGNWNGTPIMTDQTYFNDMVNTSQQLNKSYGYLWWLNGKESFMYPGTQLVFPGYFTPNAPADMFSAMGKNGQMLDVIPSENMICVRMGESPSNDAVPAIMHNEIWEYLSDMMCEASLADNSLDDFKFFPNPILDNLMIESTVKIQEITFTTMNGQQVGKSINPNAIIDLSAIESGIYLMHVKLFDNSIIIKRLVKN